MALSDIALVSLTQAKSHLRVDAAASLRIDAEYVGVGDDADLTFDLDNTPVSGSLQLYVNNVLQTETTHFSITGADITFVTAPPLNHGITANYDYAAGAGTFESYDDELLENLINAATKKAEDYTGRAFVQREIVETHIGDNKQVLRLYKQPVVSIDTITAGGDALTSWSERLTIGRLYHSVVWPLDYEIVVTYTAGYGATRAATQALVPDAVAAVLMMVAYLYENRTDLVKAESVAGIGAVTYDTPLCVLKSGANLLLNPLRVSVL